MGSGAWRSLPQNNVIIPMIIDDHHGEILIINYDQG
jgi:hypothetical protein